MTLYLPLPGLRPLIYGICALVAVGLARFIIKLYAIRSRMLKLKKQGLPMPPYNPIFGHLPVIAPIAAKLPQDIHGHCYQDYVRRTMPDLPSIFYFDPWPFNAPLLVIADPGVAVKVTQEPSFQKHAKLKEYLTPLAGEKNLVTLEGREWKTWRGVFNPGFSAGHLMTLVPGIVEDSLQFCKVLQSYIESGDIFSLEEAATRLTVDVIGRVVLDLQLHAQTSENELVTALRNQVRWLPGGTEVNPFKIYNPIRWLVYWKNTRRMNRYISRAIEDRFASRTKSTKRSKPVIDLALDTFNEEEKANTQINTLDPHFKSFAIDQVKIFMFAGHDTTSSTICYAYYLLSTHPSCLSTLISEHDSVFGNDTAHTSDLISKSPHLLNKLSYTLAVIKETLRLFPPASTVRTGDATTPISHDGKIYPTDGFMVWPASHAMHRSPTLWPSPAEFLPQRWLVPEGDPLYPVKGAWRPFEFGPRHCIGQELALLEARVILALTIRSFDINAVYAELDARDGVRGVNTMDGERAYQVLIGTAKPCMGMPSRVKLRARDG